MVQYCVKNQNVKSLVIQPRIQHKKSRKAHNLTTDNDKILKNSWLLVVLNIFSIGRKKFENSLIRETEKETKD